MKNWPELNGKRILILGYGREGRALHEAIEGHVDNPDLTVADQNEALRIDVKTILGDDYMDHFDDFDVIFKSPGIPWNDRLEAVHERVSSATQLFFDHLDDSNVVVGVTGSKGKSTVSTMLFKVLEKVRSKVKLIGNIGEAAIAHVDDQDTTFVFELSSYQLDRLKARINLAVFTNFFPDHMDSHGGLDEYFNAKSTIVDGQTEEDVFVVQARYERPSRLATRGKKVLVEGKSDFTGHDLLGDHNQENIKLVETAATELGISLEQVHEALSGFKGLPHRLEFVEEANGVRYFDDAIATTPEATLAALQVFGDTVGTLFLGGEDRGYDFQELANEVIALGIPNIVLFPNSGSAIYKALVTAADESGNLLPNTFETKDMKAAVQFAAEHTEAGEVVLLSTASPSYSVWKNFEEQGDLFQQAVRQLV